MELRQLAYFVAVAEEGQFTRAAERLSIAQPAISQQIRRLEAELGEALFVRDRPSTRLTAAGEALLPHARASLAAAAAGRGAVVALSGLLTGRLALGVVQPHRDRRLPQLLGALRRRYPGIELSLIEDQTVPLLAGLDGGTLDAAVVGLGPHQDLPRTVESLLISREPVVVAAHPEHPIARRASVPVRALRGEPMVTLTAGSGLRITLETACRSAGFTPHVVAETSDLGLLLDLVAERVGVAVLPQSALAGAENVVALDLMRPKLERRTMLAWRPTALSPATRVFLALSREHLVPNAV